LDELRLIHLPGGKDALRPLLKAVARLSRAASKGDVTLSSHDFEILEAFEFFTERMEAIKKKHPEDGSDGSGRYSGTDLLTINS
jgi:hypothetical protein